MKYLLTESKAARLLTFFAFTVLTLVLVLMVASPVLAAVYGGCHSPNGNPHSYECGFKVSPVTKNSKVAVTNLTHYNMEMAFDVCTFDADHPTDPYHSCVFSRQEWLLAYATNTYDLSQMYQIPTDYSGDALIVAWGDPITVTEVSVSPVPTYTPMPMPTSTPQVPPVFNWFIYLPLVQR